MQRQCPFAAGQNVFLDDKGPLLYLSDLCGLFVFTADFKYRISHLEIARFFSVEDAFPRILQSAEEEQLAHRASIHFLVQFAADGVQQGGIVQKSFGRIAQ